MRVVVALLVASSVGSCAFDTSNISAALDDAGQELPPDARIVPVDASIEDPDAEPIVVPDAEPIPQLSDVDAVVRYYVDEAGSGTNIATLSDAIAPALDLPILFDDSASFATVGGNRGLEFTEDDGDAGAKTAVQGTKVRDALNQATSATIELVVDVSNPRGDSRLFHVGIDDNRGRISLQAEDDGSLNLIINNDERADWNIDLQMEGRVVVHLVFDSTQLVEADRAKLYLDGVLIPVNQVQNLNQNDAIDVPDQGDVIFVLGNRDAGQRGYIGVMYYAALYSAAMSALDVAEHASILLDDDDTPPSTSGG